MPDYGNIFYNSDRENDKTLSDFSPKSETSRTEGLALSVASSLKSSPVSNLAFDAEYGYDKYLSDSPVISNDEIKKNASYRPGFKFPNGVKQNVMDLMAKQFDENKKREVLLSNMPPGLLSSGSKMAGDAIGFLLDPINLGATVLAPELIGTKVAPVLGSIAKYIGLGSKSAKAAAGAVEGVALMTPQEAVNYPTSKLKQDPETALDAMLNMGLSAGIGSVFHLKFGKSLPLFDSAIDQQAKETAVSQFISGKKITVDPLVTQGIYEQAKTLDENASKGIGQSRESMIDELSSNTNSMFKEPVEEPIKNDSGDSGDENIDIENELHSAALDVLSSDAEPASIDDIKASSNYQASADSMSGVDVNEVKRLDEKINTEPAKIADEIKDLEDEIKNLVESKSIGPEIHDVIKDAHESIDVESENRMKAVKLSIECLRGPDA